ncbi:hypothetical protein BH09PLA1_BH09PLA1_18760 [soil metagenome]
MCVDQENEHETETNTASLRVDVVDSWHKQWPTVRNEIERDGRRAKLLVDADGWLSARQCLLVAFKDTAIVGHLVFSLQPGSGGVNSTRPPIEAHQDDLGVRPGFSDAEVRKLLVDAATRQAKALRCRRLVNFG